MKVLMSVFALCLIALPAKAQENTPGSAPTMAAEQVITPQNTPVNLQANINPDELQSLFFTFWEHNALKDARNSRGLARPPTDEELRRAQELANKSREQIQPGIREIDLGGIVYTSKNDWTIWLNGERITPNALPEEVLDLRVSREYVELKWLDEYTAQIFPIRLRAHQRFNLDSRIFLPGSKT